jgi:hypothetical protein
VLVALAAAAVVAALLARAEICPRTRPVTDEA